MNQFVGSSFGSGLKYFSNQPLSRPTPSPRPASPTEPSELRGRAKAAVGARSCGNAAPRGRTRPFLCGSRPAKRRHISNAIGSLASFALNMLGNMNMFQWLNCLGRGGSCREAWVCENCSFQLLFPFKAALERRISKNMCPHGRMDQNR